MNDEDVRRGARTAFDLFRTYALRQEEQLAEIIRLLNILIAKDNGAVTVNLAGLEVKH